MQLLDGSGYNILFIGDLGQGTPRQVELSMRTAGGTQSARPQTKTVQDEEVDEQPEPPPVQEQPQPPQPQPTPQPIANPFGGGTAPRTPQEIMQELQQRQLQQQQQQLQQQQQQQQQQ